MKKLLSSLLAAAMLLCLTACGAPKKAEVSLFAMDTYMTLVAYGDGADDALTASARTINELESRLSRTREGSEIWQLNHGGSDAASNETVSLLYQARFFCQETDGAFDVTVAPLVDLWAINSDQPHVPTQGEIDALLPLVGPEHITFSTNSPVMSTFDTVSVDDGCAVDLGGIAKGYASDCVARIFAEHGVTSGTVSLGGNVYVCGTRPDGKPWNVAVQDPKGGGYACMLTLTDAFAVTSGGYQRYFTAEDGTVYQHIIDPSTGYPAQSDLLSVTVVCSAPAQAAVMCYAGTRADAYSTALYVMGEEGAVRFWRSRQSDPFEMVLITADGRIVCTPGLTDHFIEQEDASYEVQFLSP